MAIIRANNNTLSSITALPTGIATGSMVKLFSQTGNTTGQSEYDIDSTYINSSYDNYFVYFSCCPAGASNRNVRLRFFENGSIVDSTDYWYMNHQQNGTATSDLGDASYIDLTLNLNVLTGDGNGASGYFYLFNVNQTKDITHIQGATWCTPSANNNRGINFGGGFDQQKNTSTINGIRIYQNAENILMREFAIYGITR